MKTDTKCVQSGYEPKNGEPRVVPVSMSTTFKYDSTETVGDLFDLKADGFFYTRLANPTVAAVERKIADLEGGAGAMLTSSGQAASMIAVLNLAGAGDHIVASSEIYGGTFNLFAVTLKKLGVECTFVEPDDFDGLKKAVKPNTKALFGETIANPALSVLDIKKWSEIAHKNGVPLIVDNTFATAVLCRPLSYGADIVINSTSKYMDGHAVSLGGVIVDGGKFDYKASGKFPAFTLPDESYHGIVYSDYFKEAAFITKARVQLMRDMGSMISPMNAFLLNIGLETLHLRMERHSQNALKAAEFLKSNSKVVSVRYPALQGDKQYDKCQKYTCGKGSGVISFELKDKAQAVKFMDSLKLAKIVVHVADARTGVLHPASSTHRQLSDAQLKEAGISAGMIRLSCGIEDSDDIIEDLKQALAAL